MSKTVSSNEALLMTSKKTGISDISIINYKHKKKRDKSLAINI